VAPEAVVPQRKYKKRKWYQERSSSRLLANRQIAASSYLASDESTSDTIIKVPKKIVDKLATLQGSPHQNISQETKSDSFVCFARVFAFTARAGQRRSISFWFRSSIEHFSMLRISVSLKQRLKFR
jgi:hypothetical protein